MREQARENPDQYFFIYAGSIGHRDRRTSETRESKTSEHEIRVQHEQIYRVKQTARTSECESSGDEEDSE